MHRMTLVHRDTLSCEPILRRMDNGELLCVSQCGDVTEPAPGNRVYVFHSQDEGETWSAPVLIRPEDGQAVYLTEAACFPGGRIVVYLTLHNGAFLNWVSECVESTDNGYTWHSIGPLQGEETFAFPRGVIQLRDGRYMMACQHYPITPAENARLVSAGLRWLHADVDRVENRILVSSDEGRSWSYVGQAVLPMPGEIGKRWLWSEPTILELADGRIAMLLRVGGTGKLYYAESFDGGATFTDEVDGKLVYYVNMPGYKNALATIRKFYQEGLIEPDYLLMNRDQFLDKLYTNTYGAWDWTTDILDPAVTPWTADLYKAMPEAKMTVIPPSVTPMATPTYAP